MRRHAFCAKSALPSTSRPKLRRPHGGASALCPIRHAARCDVHAVVRHSGAGGGDCGIAVCFSAASAEKIREEWKNAGFYVVDADIDKEGVRAEA